MRPRWSAATRPERVLGFALAVALASATAQAPPAQAFEDVGSLAQRIAAPWPALQYRDGTFRDYVVRVARRRHHRDPYGTSMLGYALLQEGIRTRDDRLVQAALHALAHASRHPVTNERVIFENLALASAYRLARTRLRGDTAFTRVRSTLEDRLRHIRIVVLGGRRAYYNHDLVEALAVLELVHSGLKSKVPGAVLANRGRAVRLARGLILHRLPAIAARQTRRNTRAGPVAILSDPPWNPPA